MNKIFTGGCQKTIFTDKPFLKLVKHSDSFHFAKARAFCHVYIGLVTAALCLIDLFVENMSLTKPAQPFSDFRKQVQIAD